MDFAERMSLWFNAFDAIRLQGLHQSVRGIDAPASGRPRPGSPAEDFERVRGTLAAAITRAADDADDVRYVVYQRMHQDLQRRMEMMIGPLREHLRQAAGHVSPRLHQLAALDAGFEELLAPREQALLATATALLERRFEQLRRAHRDAVEAAGADDDPSLWRRPGGWLHTFENDWRQALLAELELRLEPAAGLLDALSNESHIRQ
jgi:hypothetical protein